MSEKPPFNPEIIGVNEETGKPITFNRDSSGTVHENLNPKDEESLPPTKEEIGKKWNKWVKGYFEKFGPKNPQ